MKKFSAQYAITNSSPVLKRPIISVDDDGTIISVENTSGRLAESYGVEFFNGIIIPGFVNCHCHLELSHMRGVIKSGHGLPDFISLIRSGRTVSPGEMTASASSADSTMYRNGISLCADICNTTGTFEIKKNSNVSYINLIEVFGIDPLKAGKRIDEAVAIARAADDYGLQFSIVPHSVYSISRDLFSRIYALTEKNEITSIHFMESPAENAFLENHSGDMMESYLKSGIINGEPDTARSHQDAIMNYVTPSGNLILVHNTFITKEIIDEVRKRKNLFWCLCPNSNLYIENVLPPVRLLNAEGCELVIGTDSLASNKCLDILEELKVLQSGFPELTIENLVRWATFNGAKALCREDEFGSIEPGKKPGLLLLEDVDLAGMRLTNETSVRRLI